MILNINKKNGLKLLGLSLFFFWVSANSLSDFLYDDSTRYWPAVKGTVVEYLMDNNSKEMVLYEYTVKGVQYKNSRVIYSFNHLPKGYKRSDYVNYLIKKFPIGKVVNVYYDPSNHHQSVLLAGVLSEGYIYECIIGLIVACILLIIGVYFLKFAQNDSSPELKPSNF